MNIQKENGSENSADNPLTPYNVSVAKISPGIYAIGANPAEPDVPGDRDSDLKFPRVETLLAQGVLSNRIKEWEDKLIVKKIDPWQFFRAVGVKITKYDGRLIHYTGKGLEFKGSPQLVFGNFIEPFLKKGIDEWLEHIADLCLQHAKDPKPYLQTVRNSLDGCIQDVYLRMSNIDYKLRKGAAACRAAENFGKNIQREDVRDKITLMINYLNGRYKEVLDTAQASGGKVDLAKVPISELIKQGESHMLEFKETLEYDTQKQEKNKDILHSSLKTIAGFLNAAGGTLLIGVVNDSGEIRGIERDLSTMNHGNNDRFELKIRNCLKDRFKPQPIGKVNISFEKFTEKMICRIDVQESKEIVRLDNKVYVRDGNTTLLLEGQPLTDWILQRRK